MDYFNMETLLEVLKYTIPALVVFATAYFLLKTHLDQRLALERITLRNETVKLTLPMRLQAYERLTLLCERVAIPNVLLRIRVPGMSVGDLRNALMLAINQEFEHNTAQQLYVSETLWQIITFAKNDTINFVLQSADDIPEAYDSQVLVDIMFKKLEETAHNTALNQALVAIRTEAGQLF
jgi:hypothetical protein